MNDSTPRATDARSLDVELARLLGWRLLTEPQDIGEAYLADTDDVYWITQDGRIGTPAFPGGWAPSTDISAAMSLVEHMRSIGYEVFQLHADFGCAKAYANEVWAAAFVKDWMYTNELDTADKWSTGATPAAAITAAARAAMEGEQV